GEMRPVALVEPQPEPSMNEDHEAFRLATWEKQVQPVARLIAVGEVELRQSGSRHRFPIGAGRLYPGGGPALAAGDVGRICVGVVPVIDPVKDHLCPAPSLPGPIPSRTAKGARAARLLPENVHRRLPEAIDDDVGLLAGQAQRRGKADDVALRHRPGDDTMPGEGRGHAWT